MLLLVMLSNVKVDYFSCEQFMRKSKLPDLKLRKL